MTTRVVSLMWGNAWARYGQAFVRTFERHWPEDVEIVVVADRDIPGKRTRTVQLGDTPGYAAFIDRWGEDRQANGYGHKLGKLDGDGRSWRHDAVKWAPQGLAPRAALDGLQDGDIFAWFDADTETVSDVPAGWLDQLLDGKDVACLRRPRQHPEIGFWAVRIGAATRRFIATFGDIYASGRFASLDEWHSAYVWDRALSQFPRLTVSDLNRARLRGHVWPHSPLAKHTTHKKGKRKGC